MATALDVAKTTVARATQSYVRGGMSYCQQFAGNFWETHFGRETPNSYPSAAAAYRASTIASHDPATAPPGAYHYFEYGSLGHVGVALGSGLMASGTGYTTNAVQNLGKSVYVHRVSDYAKHLKYLGWSYTNGARERITGLTDANAGPNVRTVKSNSSVYRRISPDAGAALTGKDNRLAAGSAHRVTAAYLTGKTITQNGTSTDVWFEIDAYGWAWAGGFTSQSLDGIAKVTDMRPKPAPAPAPAPTPPPVPEPTPEPAPEPTPEPEPEPDPIDPQPEPITEEDAMTVNQIITPPDLDTSALGAVVEDPRTRKRLYAWYVIAALALGALITGTVAGVAAAATLATIGLAPWLHVWVVVLAIAVGVVGYVGPYAAVLASANTPKK